MTGGYLKKRFTAAAVCVFLLLLSFANIQLFAAQDFSESDAFVSNIVFWDAGNRCATQQFGFEPDNPGVYVVPIDDNSGSIRIQITASEFQEDNIFCQMTIGEISSDPTALLPGTTIEISSPLTAELVGSNFRIGTRKSGFLIVGQYDTETETWGMEKKSYSFSFIRRIVLNSASFYDSGSNKLELTPRYLEPNVDAYNVSIPNTSETVRLSPNLTIKSSVRDEADPDGTLYKKTIEYSVPDGAIISDSDGVLFDISKLDEKEGKPYIDAEVGYSKDGSDIKTSSYRFLLDGFDVQAEEDHTPDAVIMESEQEVSCDKDDDITLKVSAQVTGEANLTYRWLYGYDEYSVNTILEEGENNTLHPSTKYAWTKYYRCCVINTVGGKQYFKYSGIFKVTVNLNFVTEPIIYGFVDDEELFVDSEKYFEIRAQGFDDGISLSYKWYLNDKPDTEGAMEIALKPHKQGLTPDRYGLYRFEKTGTYYVYCIVTASKDNKSAETQSDYVKIVVKEPDSLSELTGTGDESSPYIISSVDTLETIKAILSEGYFFKNKYFELVNDINLPVDWEPIGSLIAGKEDAENGINIQPFSGNIDGQGHTITVAEGGKPLFGYVREASVKNLKIYGKRIDGYGLINNYVVDYGTDGTSDTGVPDTCDIDNVTIITGSSILKSGFLGGYASGSNTVNISNCNVQNGVTIGYDRHESNIGSFTGELNGTITNSFSDADVYGVNNVGGLAGKKGQAMGKCSIINCSFSGSITATGDRVGGMIGAGYISSSAPNTPVVSINNCFVAADIIGSDEVGGIFGSEGGVEIAWGNGTGGVQNSFFYGTLKASGTRAGGIIGYYNSLDKFQTIENNYWLDSCGVTTGIGEIHSFIYDNDNPQFGMEEGSFDGMQACRATSSEEFINGTVLEKLNTGKTSFSNWTQGKTYPVLREETVPVSLVLSGYRTDYFVGDVFDEAGTQAFVSYSDGSSEEINLSLITFNGFDTSSVNDIVVVAEYRSLKTSFKIHVRYENPMQIGVRVILLGDTVHGSDGAVHTLNDGGLTEWINQEVQCTENYSVKDVLLQVLEERNLDHKASTTNQYDSYYIKGIQIPGSDSFLEEFSNGPDSGWMYRVNGWTPDYAGDRYFLQDGDEIVFFYTDDYTRESEWMDGEYPYSGVIVPDNNDLNNALISIIPNKAYTGNPITPIPVVTLNGDVLLNGTDYTLSYKNNTKVGTATVTVTGTGSYEGTISRTFKIVKATPKISAVNKTVKLKTVKKKAVTVKALNVKNAYGKVSYKKTKGSKYLSVTKAGKIKVKKGTPKGTYSIKVRVTVKGSSYNTKTIVTKTVKIKVK